MEIAKLLPKADAVFEPGKTLIFPERLLLAAMLERAIFDLVAPQREVRRAAQAWIRSTEESDFSFHWVLQHLRLMHLAVPIRSQAFRMRIRRYAKKWRQAHGFQRVQSQSCFSNLNKVMKRKAA